MRTTTLLIALSSGIALFLIRFGSLSVDAQDAGKEAFVSNSCNRCHAIESQGIVATSKSKRVRGPDLGNVGEKRAAEWLEKYVEKQVQANDKDHPVAWKGSDDELKAIAAWLASLE